VLVFDSTLSSIIDANAKLNLEKMSRMAGERGDVSLLPFEAPKAPQISRTSPLGQEENHEIYWAEGSAAIRTS